MKTLVNGIQKYKHRLATVALIFGFLVDLITFRTIDLSLSQIILSVHLVIVGATILILSIPQKDGTKGFFSVVRSWLPVLQQYSMGNLLSAFLVLYSASGSIAASWPFFVLVAAAAIGNETLKLQKYRLPFQTTLYFLNLLLFAALAVPIFFNRIGIGTFLVSVVLAVIVFTLFIRLGRLIAPHAFNTNRARIRVGWGLMAGFMVLAYFSNIIPPIPLSVKQAGVYYSVERLAGEYVVERNERHFFERFLDFNGETLHLAAGEPAYIFTAVFAPADFSESIVHRWQRFNEVSGEWETRNTVRFPIQGGRHGGYRGFSLTENPAPGSWRVSTETVRGQVIGRTYFTIERVSAPTPTELYTL